MRAIRGRAATAMVAITASGRVAGDEKRSDQQLIARFWRRPRRSKADLPLGMVENGEDLAHEDFAENPHVVLVHLRPEPAFSFNEIPTTTKGQDATANKN